MKIEDFEKRLENAVLIADGAMGSVLFEAAGVQRCFEELNISQPEAVFRVHQAYIQAGAQIIETNTFGANRAKLTALGLGDRVAAFNHRGVKLAREAREAAPHEVLIAGSMGPLGMGPEIDQLSHEEILEIYREQALALEERGVDLFLLETFSNIDTCRARHDARVAIDAVAVQGFGFAFAARLAGTIGPTLSRSAATTPGAAALARERAWWSSISGPPRRRPHDRPICTRPVADCA